MDDYEILQHLLDLEKQAAVLVDDAQAEADRRVSEGEKQNRTRSDEAFAKEVELLEEAYKRNIAAVKESYRRQLDVYRESIERQPVDAEVFSKLAKELLTGAGSPCRET